MGRYASKVLSTALIAPFIASICAIDAIAQPATLPFTDCSATNVISPAQKINFSAVYGQIVTRGDLGRHLNLTVIGSTGQAIVPISNETGLLSTLFTTSSILSFDIWQNSSFFCSSLRPPSPLQNQSSYGYCPLSPGPLAFSAAVPLGKHAHDLLTVETRLRVVDTSSPAVELGCIDVNATPLSGPEHDGSLYGLAQMILWFSAGITIAYWLLTGLARVVAAWGRGSAGPGRGLWSRAKGAGYILASAISGERFSTTPALLRFVTPCMRDVLFHTQFCAVLGMVAVQWPAFVYPMLAQTAWATLIYNITVTTGNATAMHWNPLAVQPFNPPQGFSDQLNDPTSPLFVDMNVPNSLLIFPENATAGMAMYAASVGLVPQQLFPVCLVLFLGIIAVIIIVSLAIWGIDQLGGRLSASEEKRVPFPKRNTSYMPPLKDGDKAGVTGLDDDKTSSMGHFLFRSPSMPLVSAIGRRFWRLDVRPSSFHGAILHGNLVRALVLFHLPITVFASYQFANARTQSSPASVILACLSFVIFSVALPIFLIIRLFTTATSKLYDETWTRMMLGPLYNHYAHGSQLFACIFFASSLIYGITIGCGQKSGTAQAIIILVTEVAASLSTSIWLPWSRGATMGLISFVFCVARITVAVLLVILSPAVSVGQGAGNWVAVAILLILGLIYFGFLMIACIKLIEALTRIFARIPFDKSKHTLDSGLLGVCGLLDCCRPKRRTKPRRSRASTTISSHQFVLVGKRNSSLHSSTREPPSVLRPEHALRPYKEESDDEGGLIMGPWQPFPQSGYGAVEERPARRADDTSIPPKSGFARVAGGRAYYDSPYSIRRDSAVSMTKHEFPSMERLPPSSNAPPRVAESPANRSTVSVNNTAPSLPPGAMSPTRPSVHVRTKSQTAVIEDASILFNPHLSSSVVNQDSGSSARNDYLVPPQTRVSEIDDSSSEIVQPKRTRWYDLRSRNRRVSEGQILSELAGDSGERSFVVRREKRPAAPTASVTAFEAATASADEQGRRSFVVLRDNDTGDTSVHSQKLARRLSHT